MSKYFIIILVIFIFLNSICCKILNYRYEFYNLEWSYSKLEINEAHIGDHVIIKFETKNVPENKILSIEIWEKTDDKLMDFINELHGIVKNNTVKINWIVDIDFNNKDTYYMDEIEKNGYTIIDCVFIIKYNDQIISSDLLAILSWVNLRILDEYGEPIRKTGIVIFAPGDETIEGITDNDGRIEMRNLRKIGDKYSYVLLGNNK